MKRSFGFTAEGKEAYIYRLSNDSGAYIEVTNYGACLVSVVVPDQDRKLTDVIGRNANRISQARAEIAGKVYQLAANNGENNLHSGPDNYEYRLWDEIETDDGDNSVTFGLFSPDGDQGFPGNFRIMVKYKFSRGNDVRRI